MAPLVKQLSLVALFAFVTFSSLCVDAREGRFAFNKMTRSDESNGATTVPETTPNGTVEPVGTLPPPSKRGYGLYGRGPDEYNAPTTTTTTTATSYSNHDQHRNVYNYPNNKRFHNANVMPSRTSPNEEFNKQYGMSDTRLYQNGRYYYDVKNSRYGYGHESNPMRRPEEHGSMYEGEGMGRPSYRRGGYYGNEFNNGVMYKNNQENQQGQEDYAP